MQSRNCISRILLSLTLTSFFHNRHSKLPHPPISTTEPTHPVRPTAFPKMTRQSTLVQTLQQRIYQSQTTPRFHFNQSRSIWTHTTSNIWDLCSETTCRKWSCPKHTKSWHLWWRYVPRAGSTEAKTSFTSAVSATWSKSPTNTKKKTFLLTSSCFCQSKIFQNTIGSQSDLETRAILKRDRRDLLLGSWFWIRLCSIRNASTQGIWVITCRVSRNIQKFKILPIDQPQIRSKWTVQLPAWSLALSGFQWFPLSTISWSQWELSNGLLWKKEIQFLRNRFMFHLGLILYILISFSHIWLRLDWTSTHNYFQIH